MRNADALERTKPTLADGIGNSAGALGAENGANWGDIIAEAVYIMSSDTSNTFLCSYYVIYSNQYM